MASFSKFGNDLYTGERSFNIVGNRRIWFSIAGVPPLSGFWAKGEVLENAWAVSPALWVIAAVTAILTAYYMGREYFLVFTGDPRLLHAGDLKASVERTDRAGQRDPRLANRQRLFEIDAILWNYERAAGVSKRAGGREHQLTDRGAALPTELLQVDQ